MKPLALATFALLVGALPAAASPECHTLREAGGGHVVEGSHYTQRLPGFKGQHCWFRSLREMNAALAEAKQHPVREAATRHHEDRHSARAEAVGEVSPPPIPAVAPASTPLTPRPVKAFTVRHVPEFDRPSTQPDDATLREKAYFTYNAYPIRVVPAESGMYARAPFLLRWPTAQPEQPELTRAIARTAARMQVQLIRGDAR